MTNPGLIEKHFKGITIFSGILATWMLLPFYAGLHAYNNKNSGCFRPASLTEKIFFFFRIGCWMHDPEFIKADDPKSKRIERLLCKVIICP